MRVWRVLLVVFGLAILASAPAAALQTLPLGAERSTLNLVTQRDDVFVYEVRVGDLEAMDVSTSAGAFTRLVLPGFHHSMREGAPELPMMNRLLAIPPGAEARVEVVAQSSRALTLADYGITNPLFPAQPSMSKSADPAAVPFVYERSAYLEPRVAQVPAAVVEVGTLRALRIGRLEISPVEYLPAEGKLVIHDRMEVRVHFEGGDAAAAEQRLRNTYSPFFEGLYQRIDGYRGQHDLHPDLVRDIVTMVIVTPPAYEAQLQTFVDWKKLRGFNVIVGVTGTPEVGSTTTSIRTWLHGLYNNGTPTQPAPSFVLFVGDTNVMPTFLESSDATDRPYCAVDADLMPDMYYGRFSCSNASNLQAMIDKTLMYDQFTMPDPSYLARVVMIAGVDGSYGQVWANGQINYGTSNYFNAAHGISSFTHLYPGSGSQDAQIVQEVSDGVAFVNYTAHGSQTSWSDPTFTQSNVNSLANNGEYCLAVGNCCLTSDYDYSTECFAETWLRAANKGAIGYIGGSNSTYWDEDYYFGVGYRSSIVEHPVFDPAHMGDYDGLFHGHSEPMSKWYVTNDAIIFCGNLAVTESGSSLISYYWTIYNLMGDPSLSCYLGVPAANPVTHPSTIMVGWTDIAITAAPNSYCGLTKDGVLVSAGTTDASGNLTLPFWTTVTPGTAHLCVTAQNRQPYQADIPVVAPSGPYLILETTVVHDQEYGDGDDTCDAGETVNLGVTIKNVGVEASEAMVCVLTSSDPLVTIGLGSISVPAVPAGESVTSGDFLVSFDGSLADGYAAPFHLDMAGGQWTADGHLPVCAPILACAAVAVDDAPPAGNGSGWIVPGETAQVILTFANSGHGGANNAILTVTDAGPYVEVVTGTATCALVPGLGQQNFTPLELRVLEGCPVPSVLSVAASIEAGFGYSATVTFPLSVGGWADDAEVARGWALGIAGDTATSGLWERADPVGTVYNGSVVQPEDDHTPDPGVACFVTGNGAVGGAAGVADVDGGKTTLLSPTFDLDSVDGASIHYWFWYTNNLGNNPGADYWDVQVTGDGSTWVNLEHTVASTNAWAERTFDLGAYITLTDRVQIRFVAQDTGSNSLVEAAVDDFALLIDEELNPAAVTSGDRPTAWALRRIAPNPATAMPVVQFEAPSRAAMSLGVYDVGGALVRRLHAGPVEAGAHTLAWDRRDSAGHPVAAGIYFIRLEAPGTTQARQVVILR